MNKNNNKSVFNNFKKEPRYGMKKKDIYNNPFSTEFGDEIYSNTDCEIDVCKKTKKINIKDNPNKDF